MKISVENQLTLELLEDKHSAAIFNLALESREHLQEWLPWVNYMNDVSFIQNYIKGSQQRNKDGYEYAFAILEEDRVIGRIGVHKIDMQNKIGEIGYWIGKNVQGKGSVTKSCKALIGFCFKELQLNRIEIKCGTENIRSQSIPEKLGFTKEGIIRQGEFMNGKFIDLNLYSLLKND
jgi:ribosomal-protein-serine acetyltransferase